MSVMYVVYSVGMGFSFDANPQYDWWSFIRMVYFTLQGTPKNGGKESF